MQNLMTFLNVIFELCEYFISLKTSIFLHFVLQIVFKVLFRNFKIIEKIRNIRNIVFEINVECYTNSSRNYACLHGIMLLVDRTTICSVTACKLAILL